MLINKHDGAGIKYLNDSKAFIEYSNYMDDIYKNIKEYNPNKKQKIFDRISDIACNRKLNPTVTELFSRGKNLKLSLVFIT